MVVVACVSNSQYASRYPVEYASNSAKQTTPSTATPSRESTGCSTVATVFGTLTLIPDMRVVETLVHFVISTGYALSTGTS